MKNRNYGTRFALNEFNNINGIFTGGSSPVAMSINTANPFNSLNTNDRTKLENTANDFLNGKADAQVTAESIGGILKDAGINSREEVSSVLEKLNIKGTNKDVLLEQLDNQKKQERSIEDKFTSNNTPEVSASQSTNEIWNTAASVLANLSQLFPKATESKQEEISTLVNKYKNGEEGSVKNLATSLGEYFKNNNINSPDEVKDTVSKLGLSTVQQENLIKELNNQREQPNKDVN